MALGLLTFCALLIDEPEGGVVWEHNTLPIFFSPGPVFFLQNTSLFFNYFGCEEGLLGSTPWGQTKPLLTNVLDRPDGDVHKARHFSLELSCSFEGIAKNIAPQPLILHKIHFLSPDGTLFGRRWSGRQRQVLMDLDDFSHRIGILP